MKAYSQFLKELPSKKVVFAFGRFQPPTTGHELLVRAVEKLASTHNAAHVIYASRSQDKKGNPLPVDRKVYYLKRMFPSANFEAAGPTTRTFIEVAKELNKKYKDLIMVAGSDRVGEYKRILESYNGKEFKFDTIQVISAGERDPDSDSASGMSGTKMREAAKKGDFEMFKKGLPSSLTTVDGRRLMNEVRQGMGLDVVKEQVKVVTDWLRESYHRGEIFKIGQIVESAGEVYEILSRGSNYLTVVDSTGNTHRKWLRDVTLKEDYNPPNPSDDDKDEDDTQLTYKGYTTINFDAHDAVLAAFQRLITLPELDPVAVLGAIKTTDTYLGVLKDAEAYDKLTPEQEKVFGDNMQKAQDYLVKLGDIQHHQDYIMHAVHSIQEVAAKYHTGTFDDAFGESITRIKELVEMNFTPSDKIKVARIIADALGVTDVEKTSSATQLLNNALRKVRSKPMRPEYVAILKNMLQTAKEAGIEYDEKLVPRQVDEKYTYHDVETSDTKLDRHGRKVRAKHLRFKAGEKEDDEDLKEQTGLSNELLARYKKRASEAASAADKKGDFKTGNKRFSGIMKATIKQFDNDAKALRKEATESEELDESLPANFDPKSKAHQHARSATKGWKEGAKAEYHKDGSATIHTKSMHGTVGGKISSTTIVDHLHKDAGLEHNRSESDYKNNSEKDEKGLTHTTKQVDKDRHTIHIKESKELEEAYVGAALSSANSNAEHSRTASDKNSIKVSVSKVGGIKSHKAIKAHLKSKGIDKHIHSIGTSDNYNTVHLHSNTHSSSELHKMVHESAIYKPEAGAYGMGQGILKYADLKRLLGIQEPFTAGGERSNDDLKDNESDQGAEAEYRTDQTSQYPVAAAAERSAGDMEHLRRQKARYHLGEEAEKDEEEIDDSEFDDELEKMTEVDHIIDAYDDDELAVVDGESGEELDSEGFEDDDKEEEKVVKEGKIVILEISRMERIRRKQRFARTKSKREVRAQIALRRSSNTATINNRARKLAISMIKKRMLRKDPSTATLQEKERVEKFLQTRKAMVDRLARRVAPRVRQIEKARLHHTKFTK